MSIFEYEMAYEKSRQNSKIVAKKHMYGRIEKTGQRQKRDQPDKIPLRKADTTRTKLPST